MTDVNLKDHFISLIKKEAVPALGCTEPIAVALAVAKARKLINEQPAKIAILVSGNIYKNGMGVGIPGTGETGLPIAAALGAIVGDADAELEVLKKVDDVSIQAAKEGLKNDMVSIGVKEDVDKLYIEVNCMGPTHNSTVVISRQHTLVTFSSLNGKTISEEENFITLKNEAEVIEKPKDEALTVKNIYEFATTTSFEDIKFVLEGVSMNMAIAREGLCGNYGLQTGKKIIKNIKSKMLKEGLLTYAMALTAAASDARMDGCLMPVMSNTGSGNQGLVAMLPVAAVAEKLNKSDEELAKAIAMSLLIPIHIKQELGQLSALCGVVVAATGASCGITYLLGGDYSNVVNAIKNMAGNIVGMICDGAKPGCALKVASGVNAAVISAMLSIDDLVVPKDDGIIDRDIEKTISNMAKIGSQGMNQTDKLILDLMTCK